MQSLSSIHWRSNRSLSVHCFRRLLPIGYLGVFLLSSFSFVPASAQENVTTLLLRPHCEDSTLGDGGPFGPIPSLPPFINLGTGKCLPFPTRDPQTRETPVLDEGELLDMDLIVQNPTAQAAQRVRSWIAYDPTLLEGVQIDLGTAFPLPAPGEADFSSEEGY